MTKSTRREALIEELRQIVEEEQDMGSMNGLSRRDQDILFGGLLNWCKTNNRPIPRNEEEFEECMCGYLNLTVAYEPYTR